MAGLLDAGNREFDAVGNAAAVAIDVEAVEPVKVFGMGSILDTSQ